MKRALITGITGQDGSYLAELLLRKGYEVHGLVRRVAVEDEKSRLSRIIHLVRDERLTLHSGDVTDYPTVWRLIASVRPDEVYHLASQSHITTSFEDEHGTFTTNASSAHFLLSAIREIRQDCRFYFAGTSDLFGQPKESPQDERTPFNPISPYGISKVASFFLTKMYREAYGIFACSGICFSHESPRRGHNFVTRKITSTVARIKGGIRRELRLGNLDVKRDWGFAADYVEAMWLMLQQVKPDDYVIGTGESHSVREFVETAFAYAGLDWNEYVVIDQALFRPIEACEWRADPAKAKSVLGWTAKTKFNELVRMMVDSDLVAVQEEMH